MARQQSAGATGASSAAGGALRITLVRSTIGFDERQARVVKGLGLRRIRHSVVRPDTPETRGMILKVRHLVTVERAG